jgi:hypothetical protein
MMLLTFLFHRCQRNTRVIGRMTGSPMVITLMVQEEWDGNGNDKLFQAKVGQKNRITFKDELALLLGTRWHDPTSRYG